MLDYKAICVARHIARLDLTVLHIHLKSFQAALSSRASSLVAHQHNGDVLADSHDVSVPVGHVLARHRAVVSPRRHLSVADTAIRIAVMVSS